MTIETNNSKIPNRKSKCQVHFRLNNIESNIFNEKLKLTNLTKREFLERAIFYDYVWYTKNERDFLSTINDTSYQISMICRNLKIICKALDEEFWNETDIDKIRAAIKEIENKHIDYVSRIKIDEL